MKRMFTAPSIAGSERGKGVRPQAGGTAMEKRHGLQTVVFAWALGATIVLAAGRAAAQVVVSLDRDDVVITQLEPTVSQRVRVGDGVRRPLGVAANPAHAYALIGDNAETGGSEIARVDLRSAQARERIAVPCCASTLAVTADDRWLAVGGEGGDRGRVYVFDREAGFSLPRTIETPGRIVREVLADGPRFVVASGEPERLPLLTRMFVTTIEGGAVATQDEVPGAFLLEDGYVGSKQVVVSSDGDDIVITRLGGRGSQRVHIPRPPGLGPAYGLGGVASATHIYAHFWTHGKVARVNLERAQEVDWGIGREIWLVAGENLAAVTQDDRLLVTTRVEPHITGFQLKVYHLTPPGQLFARGSPLPGWQPGVPLRTLIVGSQVAVASIEPTYPLPEQFWLTIWNIGVADPRDVKLVGQYRVPGQLPIGGIIQAEGFVYLSTTAVPPPTPTPSPSPTVATLPVAGKNGCSVGTTSSGFAWFGLAVLLLVLDRRRRVLVVAIVASVAGAVPATAKVIADYATMRIDGVLVDVLQPNGPARARPIPRGGGGGASGSIEDDQMNLVESFEGLSTPAVT